MLLTIILVIFIGIAILMYLLILGANKNKTDMEKWIDEAEEIIANEKWRQEHNDKQNKKKRNICSRF